MEIKIKRIISVVLAFVMFFNFHNWRGIEMRSIDVHAATFDDINQSSVFLKQAENDTCTLAAATMMLRRTAILRGDTNWKEITESKLRSTAWLEGAGLLNSFTYSNIKVKNATLDKTESHLISLLKDHPEGIVIHNPSTPHAVLLTDYTDGIFYCADPANGIAKGRIKLTNSYTVRVNNATQYWYVSSPKVSIDSKVNTVRINYNTNGGTISSDKYYSEDNGDIYKTSTKKKIGPKWEFGSGDEDGLYNASTFGLSRKGYTFLGWSTSKSGGTVFKQDDTSLTANDIYPDIATKSGTVTMYAQWEKNILTMNYNTNGGQISENETYYSVSDGNIYRKSDSKIFSVKWGHDYEAESGLYNASTFNLTRPGYKFTGWSLSKTDGTVYDQNDNTIRAATLFPDIYTKSGKVMLYAQWKENTVTINYNTNGGTISSDSDYYAESNGNIYEIADKTAFAPKWNYTYESKYGLTNASTCKLTREGYTFLGWSTSPSGEKIFDQDDLTIRAKDLFSDILTKSGAVTMYAQWKKNEIIGDVNVDGEFNVTDVVLLQKWLLGVSDITLDDWKAADLCKDDRLDVFDLCLMKRELVKVS